jgi:alpha-1,3-rhamnosyl/mannosyltransferase
MLFSALIDGRPIRTPISGVARYCIGLINARPAAEPTGTFQVLVQGSAAKGEPLTQLRDRSQFVRLDQLGRNRKVQNLALELCPHHLVPSQVRKVDIVHETYFGNIGNVKGLKVSTIHDVIPMDFPEYFNFMNRNLSSINFKRQVKHSDHLICDSRFTKQRVMELARVPEERISVIGCGSNAPDYDVKATTTWPIGGIIGRGTAYCLFIGNIEPRKNLETLVEAWRSVRKVRDDVVLVVAGAKNYLADPILERAQEDLGANFVYLGPVSEADKWSLIHHARMLVFPSFYEGFGIPVIEAYSAGTPAVFSRNSSLTELALDERQLFDAHSPSEMATSILDVLSDRAWVDALTAEASRWVEDYTWDSVAKQTAKVYKTLIGEATS